MHFFGCQSLVSKSHSFEGRALSKLQTVIHVYEQVAICPCIFGTGEYSISARATPPDLYFLMYFSL